MQRTAEKKLNEMKIVLACDIKKKDFHRDARTNKK